MKEAVGIGMLGSEEEKKEANPIGMWLEENGKNFTSRLAGLPRPELRLAQVKQRR